MKQVGDGTRALNFFIDTLIIFTLAYFVSKAWNWYVIYWGYTYYNFGWYFFGMMFIYYFVFESIFLRTPGKWFSFSKVANSEGRRPGIGWIFIRSLTRIIFIDLFFIPILKKPLHDFMSRTTVIEA